MSCAFPVSSPVLLPRGASSSAQSLILILQLPLNGIMTSKNMRISSSPSELLPKSHFYRSLIMLPADPSSQPLIPILLPGPCPCPCAQAKTGITLSHDYSCLRSHYSCSRGLKIDPLHRKPPPPISSIDSVSGFLLLLLSSLDGQGDRSYHQQSTATS